MLGDGFLLTTLLVEEEPESLERLKRCLEEFHYVRVVGEATDGREAVERIRRLRPDIVFLNIRLPGMDGFEVLKQLTPEQMPLVIFTTAHRQYALRAFDANCFDFLLKPVTKERLEQTLGKVRHMNRKLNSRLLDLLNQTMLRRNIKTRFPVKMGEDIVIVPQEEVYYFKAEEKYSFLYTYGHQFFYDPSLKKIEAFTNPDTFCRVHKSYIISLEKVQKIKSVGREYKVLLSDKNSTVIKVSRHYLPELKKKLNLM